MKEIDSFEKRHNDYCGELDEFIKNQDCKNAEETTSYMVSWLIMKIIILENKVENLMKRSD